MTATSEHGDRRRFLKLLALVGMSSTLSGTASLAQAPTPATGAKPTGAQPDSAAVGPPQEPAISADAKSLAEIIRRRYGAHLTVEQMEALTRDLDQGIKGGMAMRKFKLQNGDEPQTIFRP